VEGFWSERRLAQQTEYLLAMENHLKLILQIPQQGHIKGTRE